MNQPIRLRVRFKKSGPLCYIGHLDVMRFFQKAIRRAGMDVVYTKGFSPHQVMAFAAPLGVGLESNGEYMDIEVNSITSCRDAAESLNRAGVPGIEVVSVKILPPEAGNAMASVAAAAYRVGFREGMAPKLDLAGAVPGFLAQDRILITKETKKGSIFGRGSFAWNTRRTRCGCWWTPPAGAISSLCRWWKLFWQEAGRF